MTKDPKVELEGDRAIARFPYDPALVERVRKVPGAVWNPEARRWEAPAAYARALAEAIGVRPLPEGLPAHGVLLVLEEADAIEARLYGPYDTIKELAHAHGLAWNRHLKGFFGVLTPADATALAADVERIEPSRVERRAARAIEVALPPDLPHRPWPHQEEGYRFVKAAWAKGLGGGMLYWDMGTGKTFTALLLAREHRRVLVVAPRSVVPVWSRQAEAHLPGAFRVVPLARGSTAVRAKRLEKALALETDTPLIAVVNYESFWRGELWRVIQRTDWDLVILDESHRIKNPSGKAAKAAHALGDRVRHKLALTGTPMPHSPLDVWSQMRFLEPSVFGKGYARFRDRYAVRGTFGEVRYFTNLEELRARFGALAHRVKKEDVLELPPLMHVSVPVTLETELEPYLRLLQERRAVLEGEEVEAPIVLTLLLKLAQITSGFLIDEAGKIHRVGQSKARALEELLSDMPQGEPVVVFSRFLADLDTVREVGERLGRKVLELSGRKDEWEAFAAGEGDLLAVQFRAGSLGVDLTRAAYAVVYSPTYALGDYEQAIARLHRAGQERPVTVYHLVAPGTVDEHVYRALEAKAEIVREVVKGLRKGLRRPPGKEGGGIP